ncbi:MAG: class I SAM-dependent methyltransferase, partial [Solirubrobacteraceae bacterium]
MTEDALVDAVRAFAADDLEEARRLAGGAAAPGDDLAHAMVAYLARVAAHGATGVYASPEGFTAFIRGGGNRRLYRAVTAGLREIYGALPRPFALADVGCGDGLALVPSVEGFGLDAAVAAIEPSGALLAAAVRALETAGARFESFEMSIEAYIAQHGERRFDLIQSTFALHNLPREPRREVLAWARRAAPALAIVEFDALP